MLQQITNRLKRYSFRLAIHYLEHHVRKKFQSEHCAFFKALSALEQIVVLRFRTVPGVRVPFHILNG